MNKDLILIEKLVGCYVILMGGMFIGIYGISVISIISAITLMVIGMFILEDWKTK